uniref:Uncharacterized protein n=1 Tax=viral metagenome TaxID=1070528 RepID=A0A6C0BUT6_9ZZZZ
MINYLLCSSGISLVSTIIYLIINNKKEVDRNEYVKIFCIIMFVSLLILFITGGNSQSVVLKGAGVTNNISSNIHNTPPF